jgi:hypothetical protein
MLSPKHIARLEAALHDGSCITLHRGEAGQVVGVPMAITDRWLTMCAFVDFHFDGYRIVRHKMVHKVTSKAIDRSCTYILQQEGHLPGLLTARSLPEASRLTEVLDWAQREQALITAEVETAEEDAYLYMGNVQEIRKSWFSMDRIDTNRRWSKDDLVWLRKGDITQIAIGMPYAERFAKYAREE